MIPEFGFPGVRIASKYRFNINLSWFFRYSGPPRIYGHPVIQTPEKRSRNLASSADSIRFYAEHYIAEVEPKPPISFDPWE